MSQLELLNRLVQQLTLHLVIGLRLLLDMV